MGARPDRRMARRHLALGVTGGLSPTFAALFGSVATALAIFAGGIAVERYKRRRDRDGMALALAGAIDAMLGLIEARDMTGELARAVPDLEAGRAVEFRSLIGDNAPFQTITMAYAETLGALGGDLPFRVARFLTWSEGLQHDLRALERSNGAPERQAAIVRQMGALWERNDVLGRGLVADLRRLGGGRIR